METPFGNSTRTGVLENLSVVPLPSSPNPPSPQAHSVPLARSAYSSELELPTCITWEWPGIDTAVGVSRVFTFGAPVNVPQCSTGQVLVPARTAGPVAITAHAAMAEQMSEVILPRMATINLLVLC